MFDGDQFHQFIASSTRNSLPIPLSFPLHGNPSFPAAFEPYPLPAQLRHQEPPPPAAAAKNSNDVVDGKHVEIYPLISTNLGLESERYSMDPWCNEEVLALLKARSSLEIWFPDFTWEHVSRKLEELGHRRSAEQCKDKFEEESRHFNSKGYRILSEFDEFYAADHQETARDSSGKSQKPENTSERNQEKEHINVEEIEEVAKKQEKSSSKRKRSKDRFETFKGFCEAVVSKMMAQQEELHNKLIDDILKRDDEKTAREEAWKNQEMDRIKSAIEIREREQATAAERQSAIIEFLKKFTSDDDLKNKVDYQNLKTNNCSSNSCNAYPSKTPSPTSPSSILLAQNQNPNTALDHQARKETTPSSSTAPESTKSESDVGKRWPRDEVVALINLRCKMNSNNGDSTKGPLWERISQGMLEFGYTRSAKRCKEKWENINKYFRKTKDGSKKRSTNSRTCPYFHQLSRLYSEGTIVGPENLQENR